MKNINHLLKMTKDFLDGKIDTIPYVLDFPYELELRYPKMLKESREYAELIYDELIEEGTNVYQYKSLSDDAFRELIMARYKFVKSVVEDGLF